MLDNNKMTAIIWGTGGFWNEKKEDILQKYDVIAFLDTYKDGLFEGKQIIPVSDINCYQYDRIIVMVSYIKECLCIVKKLIFELAIPYEKIILGISMYGNIKGITSKGRLIIEENNLSISIGSMVEYMDAPMALRGDDFHFYINEKNNVIMDIGMNIGDSTMFFLSNNNVEKVYGYEPFFDTYIHAKDNLKDFLENDEKRIDIYNFGLSDSNYKVKVLYNEDMSTGLSSVSDNIKKGYDVYNGCGIKIEEGKEKNIEIKLVDVASELERIIDNHPDCNYVLKVDCEGDEYNIIQRLSDTQLLSKVSYIIIEWHYKGKDVLLEHLRNFGFSYNYRVTSFEKDMGMIYGVNLKLLYR